MRRRVGAGPWTSPQAGILHICAIPRSRTAAYPEAGIAGPDRAVGAIVRESDESQEEHSMRVITRVAGTLSVTVLAGFLGWQSTAAQTQTTTAAGSAGP